jgi:hypothetical protein
MSLVSLGETSDMQVRSRLSTSDRKYSDLVQRSGKPRKLGTVACVFVLLTLSGCAVKEAETAKDARATLVGLTEKEMTLCAGFPAKAESVKGTTIWMYEHGATNPSGIPMPTVTLPVGGDVTAASNGYCRVQLRFARGKVAEVSYAGATEIWGVQDAVCAPFVRNCIDYRAQVAKLAHRQRPNSR